MLQVQGQEASCPGLAMKQDEFRPNSRRKLDSHADTGQVEVHTLYSFISRPNSRFCGE
jgi:response regulator of citrate/malate metabolism